MCVSAAPTNILIADNLLITHKKDILQIAA